MKAYFGPEAKKKIVALVADLKAYGARIKNLDWMSAATKKKALEITQMPRELDTSKWVATGPLSKR